MSDQRYDIEYHEPHPGAGEDAAGQHPRSRAAAAHATRFLSIMLIGLGLAMIVRTAPAAGASLALGYLYGVLFIAAGVARLYLARRLGGGR